jgi:hypothetical protein
MIIFSIACVFRDEPELLNMYEQWAKRDDVPLLVLMNGMESLAQAIVRH